MVGSRNEHPAGETQGVPGAGDDMSTYSDFTAQLGAPWGSTAVALGELGLADQPDLFAFVRETGGGIFAGGLLSVASVRERAIDLSAWRAWLPENAVPFASSAVGYVYLVVETLVWVLNSHAGLIMPTTLTIEELILRLAEEETQTGTLARPTFELWRKLNGELDSRSVIAPSPAEALGGTWAMTDLVVVEIGVHLSMTGQIFAPGSELPAKILTDDNDEGAD